MDAKTRLCGELFPDFLPGPRCSLRDRDHTCDTGPVDTCVCDANDRIRMQWEIRVGRECIDTSPVDNRIIESARLQTASWMHTNAGVPSTGEVTYDNTSGPAFLVTEGRLTAPLVGGGGEGGEPEEQERTPVKEGFW